MKKILNTLLLIIVLGLFYGANAVEIKIEGKGVIPLTGYNISEIRSVQDIKKSGNNGGNIEFVQNKQINNAVKQAETRKKQDSKMSDAVRRQVVDKAQSQARANAINLLIDRTLGSNASKDPRVQEKFEDIVSQSSTYILNENYGGDMEDQNYVAKAYLVVDETAFRELLSDMGVALNTAKTRASGILIVMDEFFAQPSNLRENVLTEEVTTYKYDYDKGIKEKEVASSSSYAKSAAKGSSANAYKIDAKSKGNYNANASAGYANGYSAVGYSAGASGSHNNSLKASGASASTYNKTASSGSKSNYGYFMDYREKENEFFQNIKRYDAKSPKAENLNYTQPALVNAFNTYDIRAIDNDVFKSKFFNGKPITADKLSNSAVLATYVNAARNEAKADFFAIGVSYITDNGINEYTGKNVCDGNVFVKIYSTQSNELIAAGTFTETASGNSADQARAAVANKIGNELGEQLSKKIQDYWKKRQMYGSEYTLVFKGNFVPAERIMLNKQISSTEGVQNVSLRMSDGTKCEYTINYKG